MMSTKAKTLAISHPMSTAAETTALASESAGADRYVVRTIIDKDMGTFFVWLSNMNKSARAREILTMARLGFSSYGNHGGVAAVILTQSPAATVPLLEESKPRTEEALTVEENVSNMMESLGFDMDFFTPKAPSGVH